jgi:ABC-2 type transport system permease protein
MRQINAIAAIAGRDLMKFLRDPLRIVSTLVFPLVFIVILGGAFAPMVGDEFDFRSFVFAGVLAQTMWQSAALGLVSLIEDRENDFSQAIFVAPISRYAIVLGKISGESLVALAQGVAIVLVGVLLGIRLSPTQLALLVPASIVACLFGGAFGLMIMANIRNQRTAQQIFPFLILPQFFLAGVFNRIQDLDAFLGFLSLVSPMRYAVDLVRAAFYTGRSPAEHSAAVVASPTFNLTVIGLFFALFMVVGTAMFVRREQNR